MTRTFVHLPMPLALKGSGILQVVRGLAMAHSARGETSRVVLSDNRDAEVEGAVHVRADFSRFCPREYFTPGEYRVDHLTAAMGLPRPYMSRFFRPAVEALDERDPEPDVVIVHEGHYAAAALPAFRRRFPDAHLLYYVHNQISRAMRARELKRLLSGVDGVVAVSDYMADHVRSRCPNAAPPIHTILNGVNPQQFNEAHTKPGGSGAELGLIYVGAVAPHKGLHIVLDAIESMTLADQRSLSLTVVGGSQAGPGVPPSSYEVDMRRRATRLDAQVVFRGWLPTIEVAEAFRSADVAVVPSVFPEPFGQVALEAMATGLPVVVSGRGGLPEAVGDAGVIVEPTAEEFAEALRSLHDPALRDALRSRSVHRAAALSWATRVEMLDHVLRR